MTKTWLAIFSIILIWSAINPTDYFIWLLEVFPALVALVLLIYTRKRFKFTQLGYILILIHCIILMIGGHYTYSEVPLFNWIKDAFELQRNNYDKIGVRLGHAIGYVLGTCQGGSRYSIAKPFS